MSSPVKPDPGSDFYKAPPRTIQFEKCFGNIVGSDRNGDGKLNKVEYLDFIQTYAAEQKCVENPKLTLQQAGVFNAIACGCINEGGESNCCLGTKAFIRTDGALNKDRTAQEENYLTNVCRLTDETTRYYNCPPEDAPRASLSLVPPLIGPPGSHGFDWRWLLLLLIPLLFLLLCCGFAWVRKKKKQVGEEEETTTKQPGAPGNWRERKVDPVTSGAPFGDLHLNPRLRNLPPSQNEGPESASSSHEPEYFEVVRKRTGGGNVPYDPKDDMSEEGEDGRRKRGGGPLGSEYEEEGHKRYGAPRLPPPDPNNLDHRLRPIPPTDPEEDPGWDHPGRPIDYAKDIPGIDPGHVERYIPDGGVHLPTRPGKNPVTIDRHWERGVKPDQDESDNRKHRIQSGLGEGQVWDELENGPIDDPSNRGGGPSHFDWVVDSALGALHQNADAAHSADEFSVGGYDDDIDYEYDEEDGGDALKEYSNHVQGGRPTGYH